MPKNKKSIEEKYQEVIDALKKDHKKVRFISNLTYEQIAKYANSIYDVPRISKDYIIHKSYKIFTNNTTRRINA